ncbi:heavy metal translocating P-type ATPase [Spirochaeta lutea]|uniref:heavy metal translocating P-type ATPase n=1 Tax=Spirochaeta lutea TaxID=1480694 RepID=UPI000AA3A3AD|nr:heavy metal-associated domain-containing protein [Spirochaeta lutea]
MTTMQREVSFPIRGMTCASCASHVESSLASIKEIQSVRVNLATEQATVRTEKPYLPAADLLEAVESSGYEIPLVTTSLHVTGMTCASCASSIEAALARMDNVVSARVNLSTETATISHFALSVSERDIISMIQSVGYDAIPMEDVKQINQEELEQQKMQNARNKMIGAWAFTVPIILWMFLEMFFGITWPSEAVFNFGMIALAIPVLFWVGRKTFVSAWKATTHGHANMDTLIAIGTGVSLLTGPLSFI